MKKDVSADLSYQQQLKRLRGFMTKKMTVLHDESKSPGTDKEYVK